MDEKITISVEEYKELLLASIKKDEIAISTEEYKELLATSIRRDMFADVVNRAKYCIDREVCGSYLGFEVIKAED